MSKRLGGIKDCKYKTFSGCLKKNHLFWLLFVVSHIQRIGCEPEKTTLNGGHSRSWSAEQRKDYQKESLAAHSPPPHLARSEKKSNEKIV